MERYRTTFEIDSKTDAYAARSILEESYNAVREESKAVREGTEEARELLDQFRAMRDAAKDHRPGTLTITYEPSDEAFDS